MPPPLARAVPFAPAGQNARSAPPMPLDAAAASCAGRGAVALVWPPPPAAESTPAIAKMSASVATHIEAKPRIVDLWFDRPPAVSLSSVAAKLLSPPAIAAFRATVDILRSCRRSYVGSWFAPQAIKPARPQQAVFVLSTVLSSHRRSTLYAASRRLVSALADARHARSSAASELRLHRTLHADLARAPVSSGVLSTLEHGMVRDVARTR
jgi:hypothetical protein